MQLYILLRRKVQNIKYLNMRAFPKKVVLPELNNNRGGLKEKSE